MTRSHIAPTAVLTGPQGCGKTTVAADLARRLGCTAILDEWHPAQRLQAGALHVTCEEPADTRGLVVIRMAMDRSISGLPDGMGAGCTRKVQRDAA